MIRFGTKIIGTALIALAVAVAGSEAEAKVVMKPGFMYMSKSSANGTIDSTESRMLIDLFGAYSSEKGWTLGLYYGTEKGASKTVTTTPTYVNTATSDTSRTSTGLTAGWIATKETGGPYVLATYFFSSNYVATPYDYKGMGYQADFGYRFAIKKAFFALQLSYKSFQYDTSVYSGTSETLSNPLKHTFIDPYFTMFFEF